MYEVGTTVEVVCDVDDLNDFDCHPDIQPDHMYMISEVNEAAGEYLLDDLDAGWVKAEWVCEWTSTTPPATVSLADHFLSNKYAPKRMWDIEKQDPLLDKIYV